MSWIKNDTLKAAEDMIEQGLKHGTRDAYLRLVVAGMDAAMNGGRNSILVSLKDSHDPIHDCAVWSLDLCFRLRRQPEGAMPLATTVAAARALMVHALYFAEMPGVVTIGGPELVRATDIFNSIIFERLSIGNQWSQNNATGAHAIAPDQARMQRVERAVANVIWVPPVAAAL